MKGLFDAYEKTCRDLSEDKEGFTDWILKDPHRFTSGQFASAVAWYEKRHTWYLEECNYKPYNPPDSTWYARRLKGTSPPEPTNYVMKYFDIQKDERLITTNSKRRPVILLRKATSDWWNPTNKAEHVDYWLCLPLFTYKDRHNQAYVLRDQCLENPDAFYIPPAYKTFPGVNNEESAARIQVIQMIKEERLTACKCMCTTQKVKMSRPFRLSALALRLVLYHFYIALGIFPELENPKSEHQLFREGVEALINEAQS